MIKIPFKLNTTLLFSFFSFFSFILFDDYD